MKEKLQNLLIGLGLVAVGAVCFVISRDYTMAIGSFRLDYRIAGGFFAAVGLVFLVLALLCKPRQTSVPTEAPVLPEDPRQRLALLENALEEDPENAALAEQLLSCCDEVLAIKGDLSFDDYQQRFRTARRAVYIEEKYSLAPASRRFRAIRSAVHGGITAATARDAGQLEDALDMLNSAAQLQSEGFTNPELERRYTDTAVPGTLCWVCYWLARIYATELPNYRRSAQLLKQAMDLCPPEGIRACDLNPRRAENTKVLLTPANLNQLKHHLLSKAKPKSE